jgi:MurNAc alpha-1-phosphate uridylyltransferase
MKAMILAAGRGERMRPLTDHTPKPLLHAGGRCLIDHLIEALVADGFQDLVVNVSHLGALIEEHLGDGSRYGARIVYSREFPEPLETAGGIQQALPLLGDGPFLVVNGDIATDFPFRRLRNETEGAAHLVLIPNPPHHPAGDFALDGRRVTSAHEHRYTFAGIGVYRPSLFAGLPAGKAALAPLLRQAMLQQSVTGELYPGFWMDVGTIERLRAFDARLRGAEPETARLDRIA